MSVLEEFFALLEFADLFLYDFEDGFIILNVLFCDFELVCRDLLFGMVADFLLLFL